MQLDLTYSDIRKIATIVRRPGLTLRSCSLSSSRHLLLDVRIDLAAFIDIAAKLNRPVPISIQLELNVNLLDRKTLTVQLMTLGLDKAELPIVIRPLLRKKHLHKKLFDAIPSAPGIQVDKRNERVILSLNELVNGKDGLSDISMKRLEINEAGIILELKLSDSSVD